MQQNEVLIILRDITEEREMQERLYLTDCLASVSEMAAGIAHELNNPLTGVVALSQLLMESGVPDEMKDDIVAISKEGQRAAEVVRNLLSFARSHTLSISPTGINSVIKEVLSLRSYEHKVNNITVTTRLAPNLPEIITDRFQMQQVFLNIILNAEHAMIEANGRGNLIVTSGQNVGIIKISFTNDGPQFLGISLTGYSTPSSPRRMSAKDRIGTQHLVWNCDQTGRQDICAESRRQRGYVYYRTTAQVLLKQGRTKMENDYKKKRILAIDDEPITIRVSVKVLTAQGSDVDVACNGLVAKDMARKAEFDFFLSDIRTPAMNGMQFYEYLRQEQPGLENRVIFTTGDVMSPEVKTFLSKRNNLFLAKPFTPD